SSWSPARAPCRCCPSSSWRSSSRGFERADVLRLPRGGRDTLPFSNRPGNPGAAHPMKFGISQSITRKEDDPLLRGAGRYVADVTPQGTLQAVVLRSPHAHARFRITDTAKARALPGVRLVLTAQDVADLGLMPCTAMPPDVAVDVPPYPVLARDEVMHVGDAVAFIVADTIERARDGAEVIAVDYQALP